MLHNTRPPTLMHTRVLKNIISGFFVSNQSQHGHFLTHHSTILTDAKDADRGKSKVPPTTPGQIISCRTV